MYRYHILIEYVGTPFIGWQIQKKGNSIQRKIIVPFFMLLLVEIFPLKSSGSFFASSNSTFIFILLGVTIALINKRKT